MKTLTIPEVKTLDNKDSVSAIEGTIKKVFDQKSGEGDYGTWHLQNLILTDGEEEVTLTWCGEENAQSWQGKRLRFESTEGKKGKQGLKWEVRKVGEKRYESVKVDDRAKITDSGGAAEKPVKVTSLEVPSGVATQPEQKGPIVKLIKQKLAQFSDGYKLVLAEMHALKFAHDAEFKDTPMSDDQFTKVCNMFFMDIVKSGMVAQLPLHPIDPPKKELPKEEIHKVFPTDEEEPEIPF